MKAKLTEKEATYIGPTGSCFVKGSKYPIVETDDNDNNYLYLIDEDGDIVSCHKKNLK